MSKSGVTDLYPWFRFDVSLSLTIAVVTLHLHQFDTPRWRIDQGRELEAVASGLVVLYDHPAVWRSTWKGQQGFRLELTHGN